MKKRTVIIISVLLILIPAILVVLKGMLVPMTVVKKEEVKFSASGSVGVNWVQAKDRKLIKSGDLSFKCSDLDETRNAIETAVKQHGGFIVNERLYRYSKRSTQSLEIRVPSENFDSLVSDISEGGQRLDQRDIEIEDVTEQYLDTKTRLSVKRQLEARYREILVEAKNVTDILAIEEQLAKLREDIESAEGQLKRLDDQVALSTLDVSYYVQLNEAPEFAKYFRTGIGNGWENLVWFFIGLLNIWPFILIVIMLIGSFRFYIKRNQIP